MSHGNDAAATIPLILVLLVTTLWIITGIMSLLAAHTVLSHGCVLDVISLQQRLASQACIDLHAAHMLTITVLNNLTMVGVPAGQMEQRKEGQGLKTPIQLIELV